MNISSKLQRRFEQCALISMEKQNRFTGLVIDQTHELDLDTGKIRFADREMTMQVLGTESDNTLTWLWAWAEEQTEIPGHLIDASLQLQSWGRENGIPEFTAPSLDLDTCDGFIVAVIASHLCKASCHFRDAYEGGSAYLLLFDREVDNEPGFDRAGLVRALAELFSRYEMDHRHTLLAYLLLKGLKVAENTDIVSVELDTRERMVVHFDPRGRITDVNGEPFMPRS